ncbi:MAG: hypothetical protein IPF84_03025 [Proteobacteria bacterium]|nr:hypothetical protein [Pseudomonadota bacterium]
MPDLFTSRVLRTPCAALLMTLLAACAPTKFETQSDIPQPLIEKIPVVVGVHMPLEFTAKVYEEKREGGGGEYSIGLGKAQSAGFMRILNAMFNRVVPVASPRDAAATDPEIRGVLEPVLEDYAFVTPADSGTPTYAASLRYTIRLYSPQGELAESWSFTGYGAQPASQFPGKGDEALAAATRLAMRDAGAKLAAEFREQAIARGLLPSVQTGAPQEVELPPPPPRN